MRPLFGRTACRCRAYVGAYVRRFEDAGAENGRSALSNIDMLRAVRSHNLIAFRQVWKRFEEAVPGSIRFVAEFRTAIESDYRAMEGVILGDAPTFEWVLEQIELAEATINGSG